MSETDLDRICQPDRRVANLVGVPQSAAASASGDKGIVPAGRGARQERGSMGLDVNSEWPIETVADAVGD